MRVRVGVLGVWCWDFVAGAFLKEGEESSIEASSVEKLRNNAALTQKQKIAARGKDAGTTLSSTQQAEDAELTQVRYTAPCFRVFVFYVQGAGTIHCARERGLACGWGRPLCTGWVLASMVADMPW